MIPEKENPLRVECLAAETQQGADDASGLPSRLDRYSRAHHQALDMADYARERGDVKTAGKLATCGSYLLFRDYFTAGKVRLHAATFCKKHLLCPLCAIRRGAKQVKAYLDRLQIVQAENPGLRMSLLTLTTKNGPDLGERYRHITTAFRRMQQARRSYLRGKGPYVELAKVEGAVGSFEIKRGANSGQWHPHTHMVVLHREPIDSRQLSADLLKFTGDSMIVDVTPFHEGQDPAQGFLEVFKYALKFSEMAQSDTWHAAQVMKGKRLVFSFGLFWGVDVPEELTDERLDDLPYIEQLYKFCKGSGYHVQHVSGVQQPIREAVDDAGRSETRSAQPRQGIDRKPQRSAAPRGRAPNG